MLSLIASLIVLLMEKQNDISVLYSLGLMKKNIKIIFFKIGIFISFFGGIVGSLLGLFICLIQEKFKLIKLGSNIHFIDAYPIKINLLDIVTIQLIVIFLGVITSHFVAKNKNFYNYY